MQPEGCTAAATPGRPDAAEWRVFMTWAEQEGWRVPARELLLYRLELADSAFVLRGEDGQPPLGFVTVCRHQRSAWIGNLLVDPARRGAGIGRRLFQHAVSTLAERGAATLWLTASADGQPLYASCGFRAAGRIERWVWRGGGSSRGLIEPADRGDLHALARADAVAWGDSRVGLLTLLARGGRIFVSGSTMALLQPGEELGILGPWLSADLCPRANRTVLTLAMEACAGGGEIAVDVLGGSPVRSLLPAAGFHQTGETVLMVRGETGRGKLDQVVALASLGSLG